MPPLPPELCVGPGRHPPALWRAGWPYSPNPARAPRPPRPPTRQGRPPRWSREGWAQAGSQSLPLSLPDAPALGQGSPRPRPSQGAGPLLGGGALGELSGIVPGPQRYRYGYCSGSPARGQPGCDCSDQASAHSQSRGSILATCEGRPEGSRLALTCGG